MKAFMKLKLLTLREQINKKGIKIMYKKLTHNVMFENCKKRLVVSHRCPEDEVDFWISCGYFVRRIVQ